MAVVGLILLWIARVVLGLLALVLAVLLLALLVPVRVWLRYDSSGFWVQLRVLFFHKVLLNTGKTASAKDKGSPGKGGNFTSKAEASGSEKPRSTAADAAFKPASSKPGSADKNYSSAASPGSSSPSEMPHSSAETKTAPHEKPEKEDAKAAPAACGAGKTSEEPPPEKTAAPSGKSHKSAEKKSGGLPFSVRTVLEHLPSVAAMAGRFLGAVLHSLRFRHIRVLVPVSGGLPDQVARKVGRINAWFYAITAPLSRKLRFYWDEVRFVPDYKDEYSDKMLLETCVCGQLLFVAAAALHLYLGLKKENVL